MDDYLVFLHCFINTFLFCRWVTTSIIILNRGIKLGGLEKLALSVAKSSLEIEVTWLNGIIFEGRKKWKDRKKELDSALTKARREFSKASD